jgi:hypothetical protein
MSPPSVIVCFIIIVVSLAPHPGGKSSSCDGYSEDKGYPVANRASITPRWAIVSIVRGHWGIELRSSACKRWNIQKTVINGNMEMKMEMNMEMAQERGIVGSGLLTLIPSLAAFQSLGRQSNRDAK